MACSAKKLFRLDRCSTFGCSLPDRHAGLHAVVALPPRRSLKRGRSELATSSVVPIGPLHQAALPHVCCPGTCSCADRGERLVSDIDALIAEEQAAAAAWARRAEAGAHVWDSESPNVCQPIPDGWRKTPLAELTPLNV